MDQQPIFDHETWSEHAERIGLKTEAEMLAYVDAMPHHKAIEFIRNAHLHPRRTPDFGGNYALFVGEPGHRQFVSMFKPGPLWTDMVRATELWFGERQVTYRWVPNRSCSGQ